MHEILVISGKGGTGKTSITAAFAHFCEKPVVCDLDVDAPDLHLVLRPEPSPTTPFFSGFEPIIDPDKCVQCGICREMCKFNAISEIANEFSVNRLKCEGCGVCVAFCPEKAIAFNPRECGEWSISDTRFGPLVHAQLYPGEENSGKLVMQLRKEAKTLALSRGAEVVISDGPPGIGCPVISSLSGQDMAVVVTEPTPSGLHDLRRAVELCAHFKMPAAVIINKRDLQDKMVEAIITFCKEQHLILAAQIPYDPMFVDAMLRGRALTELIDNETTRELQKAWQMVLNAVNEVKAQKKIITTANQLSLIQ